MSEEKISKKFDEKVEDNDVENSDNFKRPVLGGEYNKADGGSMNSQLKHLTVLPELMEHQKEREAHLASNDKTLTDIDKFMESCKSSPYTDGWPEHRWREEIEKHPFFMTEEPKPGEELHPLLEGLQQLRFDEDMNSPDALADTYKDEGIHCFKRGKYKDAIINFTAGLKYKCSKKMQSELLNNRAASQFFLQNYRSSLLDSQKACELNPGYQKAKIRVARCFYELEKYQDCVETCDKILAEDKTNLKISQLRKEAFDKKKIRDRDSRKKQKKMEEDQKLLQEIKKRKINILINGERLTDVSELDPPSNMPVPLRRVHIYDDHLTWPVVFCFPEFALCLSVQEFHEIFTFADNLVEMFASEEFDERVTRARCREESPVYRCDTVSLYFKTKDLKPVEISVHQTLKEVLSHPEYFQDSGVPMFFVLVRNTETEKDFLANCKEESTQ